MTLSKKIKINLDLIDLELIITIQIIIINHLGYWINLKIFKRRIILEEETIIILIITATKILTTIIDSTKMAMEMVYRDVDLEIRPVWIK